MMRGIDGRVSFTKAMIVALLAMHWFGKAPGVISEGLLMAAAFGKATFETYLLRGNWSASDVTTTASNTQITERRVLDQGVGTEPA